jgi:tetratricopeptide (TPR) repeat protein
LQLARQKYGDAHVLTLSLRSVLGRIYETRGDLSQAETSYQTVLAAYNRMPNGRMMSLGMLQNLGRLSLYKGELEQAKTQFRAAFEISRQTRNETHPEHNHLVLLLAETHYRQGAYADAEKEATPALDSVRRNALGNLAYQLKGLSLLSVIHAKTNRHASAAAFLREALTLFNKLPDEERYQDDGLLGEALVAMKREAEARPLLQKRYAYFARTYGEQNPDAVRARRRLEQIAAATRKP